jgi:hypothetical protein
VRGEWNYYQVVMPGLSSRYFESCGNLNARVTLTQFYATAELDGC